MDHRDAARHEFIGTLPGMVIEMLPGMVIGTLPGMVIGGAAPACFKEKVELEEKVEHGKGGNLNLCGVLDISPNFVFQAASCLHCFSTYYSPSFFPR
ncbi:hypothetical protein RchiOBHm_Chr7g0242631 [Rosa chinensis]|uniref:Uncharacterized protein n=1 Tax=Rosa chinensis TaxID=74649 RepID=A0A2P6PIK4_ROSCH|nr:hypothetical protein RchiOBHm_Chr7g0242631 [Rosa chinensis]